MSSTPKATKSPRNRSPRSGAASGGSGGGGGRPGPISTASDGGGGGGDGGGGGVSSPAAGGPRSEPKTPKEKASTFLDRMQADPSRAMDHVKDLGVTEVPESPLYKPSAQGSGSLSRATFGGGGGGGGGADSNDDDEAARRTKRRESLKDMQSFLADFKAQQEQVSSSLSEVKRMQKEVDQDIQKNIRRLSLTQTVVETLAHSMNKERRNSFQAGEQLKKWDILRSKGVRLAQVMKTSKMLDMMGGKGGGGGGGGGGGKKAEGGVGGDSGGDAGTAGSNTAAAEDAAAAAGGGGEDALSQAVAAGSTSAAPAPAPAGEAGQALAAGAAGAASADAGGAASARPGSGNKVRLFSRTLATVTPTMDCVPILMATLRQSTARTATVTATPPPVANVLDLLGHLVYWATWLLGCGLIRFFLPPVSMSDATTTCAPGTN